jgi:hypothetical protein
VEQAMVEDRIAIEAKLASNADGTAGEDERPYCTQNSPAVVRKIEDANKAVRAADKAETKATVAAKEAGRQLVRLREAVKAESPGVAWSVWCADFLGHFGIRTIERYIALVEPPKPTADDDADAVTTTLRRNADATNAVRQKRHRDKLNEIRGEPTKETPEASPRRKLTALVAKLSETEAAEVLAMVMKWRAKR